METNKAKIQPLGVSSNGVEKKQNSKFKTIIKSWWPYLSMFVFLLVAMNFFEDEIYVSAPVWYGIQAALLFGIFSIFKWGGPSK